MRRSVFYFAVLLVAVLCIGPISSASASPCQGVSKAPGELTIDEARMAVHCLINQKRQANGARKLRQDQQLENAAQQHSAEMDLSNYFSHTSADGSSPPTRIVASGYLAGASRWAAGEILVWGSGPVGSPRAAVRRWMQSPAHRVEMLARRFRDVGIGVAFGSPMGPFGSDTVIYTVDFGYRK